MQRSRPVKWCYLWTAGLVGLVGLFLACAAPQPRTPLHLPEDAQRYLTDCRRITLTSYSSTWKNSGITVQPGDMVLLFGSGTGSMVYPFGFNLRVKIGNGPETTPFATYSRNYDYGYFMAARAGGLKIGARKLQSGHKLFLDIMTFPEKHESKLFAILKGIRDRNPADDVLRAQIDGFLSDFSWIGYTDLKIESSPDGAAVYLNDKHRGQTPLTIKSVDKHTRHKICLQHERFQPFCETFDPQVKSRFSVALQKTTSPAPPRQTTAATGPPPNPDRKPPRIALTHPARPDSGGDIEVSGYEAEIRGKAQDESGIVWVKINGEDINLDPDGTFWARKELAVGRNTLTLAARDIHGNVARQQIVIRRLPVRIASQPVAPPRKPPIQVGDLGNYFLLAIGNNQYQHLPHLVTAANDARAVARICQAQYGFRVELIIDGTRRRILQTIDRYRRNLTPKDNLLIYYAGHGYFDRDVNRGYWLPVDAMKDTSADWISNADITDKLKVIKAKHIMVVADSCYSGTLTRGIKMSSRNRNYLSRMARKKSRTVLTSGGLEPVVDNTGGEHSVFARVFLDILLENEQILDATGLFEKLRRPVMLNSTQTPQYSDIRLAGHEGGDFLFYRIKP